MLFAHLPFWANAVILALLLIGKYFIVHHIETSLYYKNATAKKGWMASLNIVAGLNGLVTALLLLIPAGIAWAIVLGLADFIIHWLVGYWKIKKMMPQIDDGNISEAMSWLASIWKFVGTFHAATYVSLASWIMALVRAHPDEINQLLGWLHIA